jgi:hypothetical protein
MTSKLLTVAAALVVCLPIATSAQEDYPGCSETVVYLEAGTRDDFAIPYEAATPDANLLTMLISEWGANFRAFDQPGFDKVTAHTFTWPAVDVCGAMLEIRMRSQYQQFSLHDRISLEFRDEWLETGGEVWRWTQEIRALTGTAWDFDETATLTFDLANLPVDLYGRSSVLTFLQDGNFDVYVDDDTMVDYMALWLCTNCTVSVEEQTWGAVKQMYRD